MGDLVAAYGRTQDRIVALVEAASDEELARVVPACPGWTVHELVAHVVGMPSALAAGALPTGPIPEWLDELVAVRRSRSVAELVGEWRGLDGSLGELLLGPAGLLFDDLAVHEHDLRAALGRPDRAALEVDVVLPRTLAGFRGPLTEAGLGAIEVHDGGRRWRSHDAEVGWALEVDAWEAVRAVNSRRTAEELTALPHHGDPEPYLAVLDAHLPLPTASLGE
jgi:uncharacterized protein (TIGR03083 family)